MISVGRDNSYGHPAEEVLSRLDDAGVEVFRTDRHGHVVARSDGRSISFSVERNAPASAAKERPASAKNQPPGQDTYILNTNSKKFHLPGCSAARRIKDSNRKEADSSRQQLLDQDYEPCGLCRP